MTPREKYDSLLQTLLMHRMLYYVFAAPIISDAAYDQMEDDLRAMEQADPRLIDHRYSPTQRPGSDRAADYPVTVQVMARAVMEDA